MDLSTASIGGKVVVTVTPKDPAKFVAGLLAEGQAQLRASHRILSCSDVTDASMLYLLFHTQTPRSCRFRF